MSQLEPHNVKFDLLLAWLKDLESEQVRIEAEIERVSEMIEATLFPIGEREQVPPGAIILEFPPIGELMRYWARGQGYDL